MKKILFLVSLLALFVLSCGAKASKDKNVIKIGVIGALTGNVAQYGTSTINGFKLKVWKQTVKVMFRKRLMRSKKWFHKIKLTFL